MKYPKGKHTKPIAFFKPNKTVMKTKKSKVKTRGIKDFTITTAEDVVLDFGTQVETIEDVEIGMTATIEGGGVPDGDYIMPNGEIWTFDQGTLTEKKFPPEETTEKIGTNAFGEKVVYLLIKGRFFSRARKKISRIPGKPVTGI
jgi:hypothetical protein